MKQGIDSIDRLLVAAIVFFVVLMMVDSVWQPNDGQTFQVLTGLVTGFAAAFLARLKPPERHRPEESRDGASPEKTS